MLSVFGVLSLFAVVWFLSGAVIAVLYWRESAKDNPYGDEPEGFAHQIGTAFGCVFIFLFGLISVGLWLIPNSWVE